jgi:hypothetical protein
MQTVIRNGEYLFTEDVLIDDIIVPIRPHSDAIFSNGEWVLDLDSLFTNENSKDASEFLKDTDWKVIRHRDQLALGIKTSLSDEEYLKLLQQRQDAREKVITNDIVN